MILSLVTDFCVGLATLSFVALMGLDILSYASSRKRGAVRKTQRAYRPKTLVMVPCRGMDLTLEDNLRSMSCQVYRNYRLIAIVDSEADAALTVIRRLHIDYIVSRAKCTNCSGKVRAVGTALERFPNYGAYVIADSDVLVGSDWLHELLMPLSDKRTGLSTMYPYFRPVSGFWSKVKMMWGFVGDSLLERESSRFGWGGSLAFRRDMIDKASMDFFKNSQYSVSDDICLTKIAKSKGLRIAYVPRPKPVVNCKESFGSLYEWANRQTALTLLGYRKNLYIGVVYYSMEVLVFVSGILLSIFISPLFLLFFLHYLRNVAIGFRRSGVGYLEIPIIVFILPFLYDINLLSAWRMKSIRWRGREYSVRV